MVIKLIGDLNSYGIFSGSAEQIDRINNHHFIIIITKLITAERILCHKRIRTDTESKTIFINIIRVSKVHINS